jgi:predicted permease
MPWTRYFRRSYWDRERASELESYLEIETDDNIARGMEPSAARAAARRKLGNATIAREEIFRMNTIGWLDGLWRDLRHGARLLRRSPGFTAIAVLSLALGVGANAAIFQLIDAIDFRRLPVDHPEQLAEIKIAGADLRAGRSGNFSGRRPALTVPIWNEIQTRQDGFSSVVAWGSTPFDLSSAGEMRFAQGLYVSGNFFAGLGVPPAFGRVLTDADDVKGCAAPPAVLGHGFWEREYGADPSAVGRTILLDRREFPIVGVAPARFTGVEVARTFDVAVPICSEALVDDETSGRDGPSHWFLAVLGRVKPGWTIERASAQLGAVSPAIFSATASPTLLPDIAAAYRSLRLDATGAATGISSVREDYDRPLWVLLGTSALVVLIACANIANLLLARATAREREMAIRLAIGASRARLIGQLLAESVLLSALGVAAGAGLGSVLSRGLTALIRTSGVNIFMIDVNLEPNWHVWTFTAAVAVVTCILFGLAPAISATRGAAGDAMKSGGRGASDARSRFDFRRVLVVAQIALGLVLVVAGLLFVRTFQNLVRTDAGFSTEGVWDLTVDPQHAHVATADAQAFTADLVRHVRAVPGVEAAAVAHVMPMSGSFSMGRVVLDGTPIPRGQYFAQVGPEYFSVLRTPILRGRAFTDQDGPEAPPVALVNESFVREFLHGADPVGHRLQRQTALGQPQTLFEIVGLVKDTKYTDFRESFRPIVYLAYAQFRAYTNFEVLLRTRVGRAALMASVAKAIADVNPAVLFYPRTFDSLVSDVLVRERVVALLSSFFSAVALLLAAIGLYGVMSFAVVRRTTEIGVRMALGATRRHVVSMIVGDAARLLAAGLAIGAAASVGVGHAATALLFGVSPGDPLTIALAAGALTVAGALASYLPAARAAALEPTVSLRAE